MNKNRVVLMNSAMMPQEGLYTIYRIPQEEFFNRLKKAYEEDNLHSYIGYSTNIDFIARHTGIVLPLSREQTTLQDGDTMLIMKLKYRLQDPSSKGKHIPSDDDYEFFIALYKEGIFKFA